MIQAHASAAILALTAAIGAAVWTSACASSSSPAPVDAGLPIDCATFQLGWGKEEGGQFVPFRDDDTAEITRGFQGFRFIDSVLRVSGGAQATKITVRFRSVIDGQPAPVDAAAAFDLPASASPDGARVVPTVQVFYNDTPMPELLGRDDTVEIAATAGTCTARTKARVKLALGPCQPAPEGKTSLCADGGL